MTAKTSLFIGLAAALALSACADTYGNSGYGISSYDANGQTHNARNAAIAGAVLGGVLGATADGDERLTKAAAGAIAGAAVGGIAGSLLDRQAQELQSSIGGNGTTVTNTGSNLIVNMPQDVLFATDSTAVSSGASNDLNTLAQSLNRYPNTTIQIIGHTDSTGSDSYNQSLSERRAQAVSSILQQGGVTGSRISAYGRGESQPVATNDTPEGRAQNRRVQIVITPTNR